MNSSASAVDDAIMELDRLKRVLMKGKPRVQVTLSDERSLAKATALAWFNSHRPRISTPAQDDDLATVDAKYKQILESSDRAATRSKYLSTLWTLRLELVRLRSKCLSPSPAVPATADQPPDFAPLVSDPAMQSILVARWEECTKCLAAQVPLASTVMMGGLLEAILLARINKEPVKKSVFTAKSAPKDVARKTKPLSEWMLKDYIQVAHELGWISVSARDVGAVLRDYRNYIHPQKQLSHGIQLTAEDATLFWEISKSIARQVVR